MEDTSRRPRSAAPKALGLITPLLCLALVFSGCKERPAQEKAGAPAQDTASDPDGGPPFDTLAGNLLDPVKLPHVMLSGEVDAANRYPSAVLIETSLADSGAMRCSGVLVAPRLVLTAGHCVCLRHEAPASDNPGGSLIDTSACAPTATLISMTYLPRKPEEPPSAVHVFHHGEVRPHPALRILLDAQGGVTSLQANLAVILLNEPAPAHLPPVKLGGAELQPGAPLVMVGYGSDESAFGLYGHRRFNQKRVARFSADRERILLDPPKPPLYENDSGGPCLRETTPRGAVLVGISSRGLGNEPACMNTLPHRDWLRAEILKAARAR